MGKYEEWYHNYYRCNEGTFPSENLMTAKLMEADAEIERQAQEIARLRGVFVSMKQTKHHESEDCWYSCPKSDDGCCDENAGTECTCGTDARNRIIDEALTPTDAQD